MSLVALDGTPLVAMGINAGVYGNTSSPAAVNTTMDAANEACIMIGRVFTEDGASHTINTTGSSSLGWLTGAVTFANVGTTVKVGLAAVTAAAGPPGRAANASDVITLDVSKSYVGNGGGITATTWMESVPDAGTKTVANGDLVAFCIQMTARVSDSVIAVTAGVANAFNMPTVTSYVGGSYTSAASVPNASITFSDGKLGFFLGGTVQTSNANTTWNSGSATKEYGNYFLAPFPMKVYGLYGVQQASTGGADCDWVLYSDPLGTPVAEKTYSVDANTIGASGANRWAYNLFPAPYSAKANQPLAVILKPGATNVLAPSRTVNVAAYQKADAFGANGYAVSRASGAFAAVNSNKDRYYLGLLVGALSQENSQLINSGSLVG